MKSGAKQKQHKQAGALVPVARARVACRVDAGEYEAQAACHGLARARSDFLVQLTRQYENAGQALKRRAETRATASKSYGKTNAKTSLRHLVWA